MNFTHPTAMKPSSPDFKVREPSTRLANTKRWNRFPLYLSLACGSGRGWPIGRVRVVGKFHTCRGEGRGEGERHTNLLRNQPPNPIAGEPI